MAKLHEKMYQSENLKYINVQEHITELTQDLVQTYSVGKKTITNVNIAPVIMGIETLVPLGLVINEIITNSLKYAFVNNDDRIIKISLKQLSNNRYEMIIGDNGIGKSDNKKDNGLGTKLIGIFVKQMNGTIEQLAEKGVVYKLIFENID